MQVQLNCINARRLIRLVMPQSWTAIPAFVFCLGPACVDPRHQRDAQDVASGGRDEDASLAQSDGGADGSPGDRGADTLDAASKDLLDASMTSDASSKPTLCGSGPLAQSVTSHACLHAEAGPFRQLTASRSIISAPDVSRPHTHFSITVPLEAGELSYLRFEATSQGEHAFFTQGASVVDAVSANTGTRYQASPAWPTECRLLPTGSLIDLHEPGFYTLVLRAAVAAEKSFALVIEPLSPLGSSAWSACSGTCDAGAACGPLPECSSSGPCRVDSDCCLFCHDGDHCH